MEVVETEKLLRSFAPTTAATDTDRGDAEVVGEVGEG